MKRLLRQLASASRYHHFRGRNSLIIGILILAFFCLVAVFADLLATYDYRSQSRREPMAPSSSLRFRDVQGNWHPRPFIYARRLVDPLERRYEEDTRQRYPLELFARGYSYKLFGLFDTDRHLFGVQQVASTSSVSLGSSVDAPRLNWLGTDVLGRDRFSRLVLATRFSLIVGPIGTLLASALGILIGLIAGYAGSWLDAVFMRAADVMMALPTLVLILAARAAFPLELPPTRAATLLITIFVVLGWAEMARLTRGLTLELRQREFVQAAVSIGCSPARILFRHILPNAARPLLAQTFLMLPAFLLAETSLSFLGVGLQEPEASWGNLLADAANLTLLESHEAWPILAPAFVITVFVLGVRLFGHGLEKLDEPVATQFSQTAKSA
jgi:peptide/nickel transport system permease protein